MLVCNMALVSLSLIPGRFTAANAWHLTCKLRKLGKLAQHLA